MKRTILYLGFLFVIACGGAVDAPAPEGADHPPDEYRAGISVADTGEAGECWRCADRAWRNVCVVPAVRAPDAESCLHCGEHCVSDTDAGGD